MTSLIVQRSLLALGEHASWIISCQRFVVEVKESALYVILSLSLLADSFSMSTCSRIVLDRLQVVESLAIGLYAVIPMHKRLSLILLNVVLFRYANFLVTMVFWCVRTIVTCISLLEANITRILL